MSSDAVDSPDIIRTPDLARASHSLGYVALARQAYDEARALFTESMQRHQQLGVKRGIAEALAGFGVLLAAPGFEGTERAYGEAVHLLGAADAHFSALGAAAWPADKMEAQRALDHIYTVLSQDQIAALGREGRAMTTEEAARRALGFFADRDR